MKIINNNEENVVITVGDVLVIVNGELPAPYKELDKNANIVEDMDLNKQLQTQLHKVRQKV
jgi:hypothetical protein